MTTQKKKITEEGTAAAASLQTKPVMMSGMLAMMASMSAEDMVPWYQDAMQLAGLTPDAAKQNADSIRTGKGVVAEEAKALFAGDTLTEEAQAKVVTLIEHAVELSEALLRASLNEEYEKKLTEATAEIQEATVDSVDQYLSHAVNEWQKKNEVAITSALKVERADRLLAALGTLISEAKITIPEGSDDVVEGLKTDLDRAKTDLNEQIEANIALQETISRHVAMSTFKEVCEGMTKVDIEKFKTLIENMDISDDAVEMKAKLTTIKEAHFKKGAAKAGDDKVKGLTEAHDVENKTLTEDKVVTGDANDPATMAVAAFTKRYVR